MLERLKLRLEITTNNRDALLNDLLLDAESYIQGYTGRHRLPILLQGMVVEMAAGAFNRLGAEGEASHNEGGVSVTLQDMPKRMTRLLDMYRLAKVGE